VGGRRLMINGYLLTYRMTSLWRHRVSRGAKIAEVSGRKSASWLYYCVVSLVSDGMTRYPTQKSMRERNYQTSFIIWSHLPSIGEHTYFAGTATVNRSPHQHSSRRWLEAPAGSSTKKLAATSGRRHWPICWCCPDRGPGSFDVEDATTFSWPSAAVSEWVSDCLISSA